VFARGCNQPEVSSGALPQRREHPIILRPVRLDVLDLIDFRH
jgi:hypothetical protein